MNDAVKEQKRFNRTVRAVDEAVDDVGHEGELAEDELVSLYLGERTQPTGKRGRPVTAEAVLDRLASADGGLDPRLPLPADQPLQVVPIPGKNATNEELNAFANGIAALVSNDAPEPPTDEVESLEPYEVAEAAGLDADEVIERNSESDDALDHAEALDDIDPDHDDYIAP